MSTLRLRALQILVPTGLLIAPGAAQQPGSPEPAIDPAGITGSLVIGGGGGLPDAVFATFVELAGGEQARVVVVPTASARADREDAAQRYLSSWRERAVTSATLLHTRDRDEADTEAFCAPLTEATGVWFSGGDQSRITAAYLGTRVERELRALLARGGVIGGSSAGAAIMSRVMITGGREVATSGRGFGFLPGGIVDQHFLARDRQQRLIGLLNASTGLYGIGIDEGTALVVRGRQIRVVGRSRALVYLPDPSGRFAEPILLADGENTDLVALQRSARRAGRR